MTATIAGEPVHTVHTRRAHACSFCDGQIPIGASVITWTILVGGEGWTRYYAHHACDVLYSTCCEMVDPDAYYDDCCDGGASIDVAEHRILMGEFWGAVCSLWPSRPSLSWFNK